MIALLTGWHANLTDTYRYPRCPAGSVHHLLSPTDCRTQLRWLGHLAWEVVHARSYASPTSIPV